MRTFRILLAAAAGALLYQVVVVIFGGMAAAIAVPPAYFNGFGRQNGGAALALIQLVTFSVPAAVLIAGGALAAHRLLSVGGTTVLLAVLSGSLACFCFWLVVSSFYVPEGVSLLPPWWAVSGFLAPWLGFAFAYWAVRKRETLNTF